MNDPFQLVTNCTFKGKDYLVQMCVINSKKIELVITDKLMAENWQCEYDASYIEALTHKTGNFKQFDVFVMMLKSGLLKTSDCISLDLLTLEDLEHLRCKKIVNSYSSSRTNQANHLNRRYLILTYSVEFDRIHYPLPLDYCGPPDPTILQGNIRRLENEIERLKQKNNHFMQSDTGDTKKLKEKVQNLIDDNTFLTNEVYRLNKLLSSQNKLGKNNQVLQSSLKKLERQILYEKNHNHQIIFKLRMENRKLKFEIEELKKSKSCLTTKLRDATKNNCLKACRRCKPLKNYFSPENSLGRKSTVPGERADSKIFSRPITDWNPSISKCKELKTLKKCQNTFLNSSSSESENYEQQHKPRPKVKKQLSIKQGNKSELFRKSSYESSKHSSEDSRKSTKKLGKHNSQEGKQRIGTIEVKNREKIHSRESSLSSRDSSKHSKISWLSNRGSGDHKVLKSKPIPEGTFYHKTDIKFSMSDLENRIHALQKLLNDGLNF